jgi:DNA-binding NarL/FixJ family response regulator
LSSIAAHGGFRVVAECRTPQAGIAAVAQTMVDVAVMDADAAELASPKVAELAAACRLLLLVADDDVAVALGALRAGARGCVPRSSPADVVLAAMRVAAHGETVVGRSTIAELLRHDKVRLADAGAAGWSHDVLERLTQREIEVLLLITNGWDNTHIGAVLFISPRTVKNHVARILEKLGLENRIQAAVFAVRLGLTESDGHSRDGALAHPRQPPSGGI